jgi:hypothetical protein
MTSRILAGFVAIALAMFAATCFSQGKSVDVSGPIAFENIAQKSGVTFVMDNSASPRRFQIETMIAGVAILDYNN